jgi:N-acyl-D-amino-acid deacylase
LAAVIDHAALRLHKPVITYDLPAGGRRPFSLA